MKFAHMADCHIGGWREPVLREASVRAFVTAIDSCIEKNVDFIIISGDLFNTSLPAIDKLKVVVEKLKELKDREIPVYIIAGSHDFSPSGKTMIDVLEKAGLVTNVVKGFVENNQLNLNFTIDRKTGAKIAGMLGKKGMLEKKFYETLNLDSLERESGYKIFIFHTAITELKTPELEKMDSSSISLLPKNFNYYAGGHVHDVIKTTLENYGTIAFPGALFPNNFKELEKFGNGGFYIIEDGEMEWVGVNIHKKFSIRIDCDEKTTAEIESEIRKQAEGKDFENTIVTLRLYGLLREGKPLDIDFREIVSGITEKGAVAVLKNINSLVSRQFEAIRVSGSVENIEERLFEEHLSQLGMAKDDAMAIALVLAKEKQEGEKTAEFEQRLLEEARKLLGI